MLASTKKRTAVRTSVLVVASYALALLLFWCSYEVIANIRYSRWRARFDDLGWFGKLTVPSPHPGLLWEYRPYGQYHGEMGDIVVNRYGFRDKDYPTMAKPAGVRRVAFIGDSVTLGVPNAAEETFVRQFEAAANTGIRPTLSATVQALNLGVDGYDTRQVFELLRLKVLGFEPDCIVYVMCLNDFDFEWSSGDKRRYFTKPRSFLLKKFEEL